MTLQVGDKIAHPLHGAGVIDRIEKRKIGGTEREYYVMKLPIGDMIVMIPKDTCGDIGVRPIVPVSAVKALFRAIPTIDVNMTANWNKRFRENMQLIKSGDLLQVAAVIKGLMLREAERGLSTGERKMLHSAKQILLSEVALVEDTSFEEAEAQLDACMV